MCDRERRQQGQEPAAVGVAAATKAMGRKNRAKQNDEDYFASLGAPAAAPEPAAEEEDEEALYAKELAKAKAKEEKRLKAEAEQRLLLGTPEPTEPEPEPEAEPEPEGEPEPIPEMLDRMVQEHFKPIKKHAEATLRPRMEKLQAYFDELLVKAAAVGLSEEEAA